MSDKKKVVKKAASKPAKKVAGKKQAAKKKVAPRSDRSSSYAHEYVDSGLGDGGPHFNGGVDCLGSWGRWGTS